MRTRTVLMSIVVLGGLSLALAVARHAAAAEPPRVAIHPAMERPADLRFNLEGPVARQMQLVSRNWLLRAPDTNPAMLAMLAERDKTPPRNLLPWSGEFAGKYLTAATETLRVTGDAELRVRLARFVSELIACQAPNGYLGAFSQEFQLTGRGAGFDKGGTWDVWNHYHAMIGLLTWHDQTGDKPALIAARRIGDLLCTKFAGPEKKVVATGSAEMNQAVVHSLALLYHATGERKYLELAEEIVAEFAEPGAGDYLRTGLAGGEFFQTPKPRWESLHPIMGLAELYWITGKAEYRRAFEQHWWSIARLDRHNNGGFSSGEQAQGNPYHGGAIETCCTIAWMAMSVEMLRMTGNPIVADELELSTLNQVVGLHGADGSWCTYNTPMDGVRLPSSEDIAFQIRPGSEQLNCCSVNAARGFGLISAWAAMNANNSVNSATSEGKVIALNWYGPGAIETKVGAVNVTLRQKTEYPRSGRIVIEVEPAEEVSFTLLLRIPHWSTESKVDVNGAQVTAKTGTYAAIDRRWKRGDRVTIDLDFAPRYWTGERECAGKVSIYRGPILLALETSGKQPTFSKHFSPAGPLRVTNQKGATVETIFDGDRVKWNGFRYDDGGKSRVSIDGKQVAIVDQYGPGRDLPFSWEQQGLAKGKHTLRIEVLGEKVAASKGVWANVGAIEPMSGTSKFDLATQQSALAHQDPKSSGRYSIKDDQGHEQILHEYGLAGADRKPYVTWLELASTNKPEPAAFSRERPGRTIPIRSMPVRAALP